MQKGCSAGFYVWKDLCKIRTVIFICGQYTKFLTEAQYEMQGCGQDTSYTDGQVREGDYVQIHIIPYPTAFPYGNGMVLHFYQQQESSTTKTVHKVINKGLKTYV